MMRANGSILNLLIGFAAGVLNGIVILIATVLLKAKGIFDGIITLVPLIQEK